MRFEETYRLSSCSVNSGRSRSIRVDYLQLFLVPVIFSSIFQKRKLLHTTILEEPLYNLHKTKLFFAWNFLSLRKMNPWTLQFLSQPFRQQDKKLSH